jgi:hypothetical protein
VTSEQRKISIAQRRRPSGADDQAVHKMWVREKWRYFPVWDVPIDALVLNVDNKRFGAERDLVEARLGRPLDPANNPIDDESIVAILCDSSLDVDLDREVAVGTPSKDFEALKEDWQRRQQAEPLWIRPDGLVRNGNRRLAMLKRLRGEGLDISWVEAIILEPEDIDEAELFRMEQREQLAENFKKRYLDINALLALKEAAELEGVDWDDPVSLREMSVRLKHYAGRDDASYALIQLQAIRAITAYLEHLGVPGRYSLVTGQVEVFREVGKCMSLFEEEPEDGFELVQAAFAFVQAGKKYQQLRLLRKMFTTDRERFRELVGEVQQVEDAAGWQSDADAGDVVTADLDVLTAPATEDEPDEPEAVAPAHYPKDQVGAAIDSALDAYSATLLDVTTQLTQALARLNAVDVANLSDALAGDGGDEVRELLAAIAAWVDAARTSG